MEPARPRAERQALRGPGAGRLHFGIWRICLHFATIRLFSLQRAHVRDAKFLRQQSGRNFVRNLAMFD